MITTTPAVGPSDPLAMAAIAFGALLLAFGLLAFLGARRGAAGPPDWWGRLDGPAVPEPVLPLTSAVGGGSRSLEPRLPAAPEAVDGGGYGPDESNRGHPQNSGPPVAYQAVVLEPAGKWGSYWEEAGRCQHRHSSIDGAYDCARSLELRDLEGEGRGQVIGIAWAE